MLIELKKLNLITVLVGFKNLKSSFSEDNMSVHASGGTSVGNHNRSSVGIGCCC